MPLTARRGQATLADTKVVLAQSERLLIESADQVRASCVAQDRSALLMAQALTRIRESQALLARTRCPSDGAVAPLPAASGEIETWSTVLVADDDPALLEIVSAFLRPVYRVWTARDGFEAMHVLLARPVDLLIADLNMPGLDGMQLVKQARLLWPDLKFLYLTGFPEQAETLCRDRVLHKPIRSQVFLGRVAREMARA